MGNSILLAKSIVIHTLDEIKLANEDSQKCVTLIFEGADKLDAFGQEAIDAFIELLESDNHRLVALAMLYLGMFNELDTDATRAIDSIKDKVIQIGTKTFEFIGMVACSMIGESMANQLVTNFMKFNGINSVSEFRKGAIATIMRYVFTGQEIISKDGDVFFITTEETGEKKMTSLENQDIWKALDRYFTEAGSNSEENVELMRTVLSSDYEKLKIPFIFGGFSWLLEAFEKQGDIARNQHRQGVSDLLINQEISNLANSKFLQLSDIVDELGTDVCTHLIAAVATSEDEDEIALLALMIVRFISTLDNNRIGVSKTYLLGRYQQLVGTSCKMAMAWALYNFGERGYWEDYVFDDEYYFEYRRTLMDEKIKSLVPSADANERKDYLCREFAVSGITKIGVPPHEGLLDDIARDVASDGKLYSVRPHWTRKPKNTY